MCRYGRSGPSEQNGDSPTGRRQRRLHNRPGLCQTLILTHFFLFLPCPSTPCSLGSLSTFCSCCTEQGDRVSPEDRGPSTTGMIAVASRGTRETGAKVSTRAQAAQAASLHGSPCFSGEVKWTPGQGGPLNTHLS